MPALTLNGPHEERKLGLDCLVPHARDHRELAGLVARVEPVDKREQVVRLQARARLESERIADAAQEVDMGAVYLARTVADPEQVCAAVVTPARGRIDTGQRLLVFQKQGFVGGVELGLTDLRRGLLRKPTGRHEVERLADLIGQRFVTCALGALGDEAQVPAVNRVEVGIAALGQRAQQVERRRGLAVGAEQTLRRRRPLLLVEGHAVDHVAAVGGERLAVHGLGIRRARLGELARKAPDLDDRQLGAVGQHHRHLQEDAKSVPHGVGMELREALRTVAALQQEGAALADPRQTLAQPARLAGEDQRGRSLEAFLGRGERDRVGPVRLLLDRQSTPTAGIPRAGHVVLPRNLCSCGRAIRPNRPPCQHFS